MGVGLLTVDDELHVMTYAVARGIDAVLIHNLRHEVGVLFTSPPFWNDGELR